MGSPRYDNCNLQSRRSFLIGCGSAATFALTGGVAARAATAPAFHLHPHYRERLPLEPILAKRDPAADAFPLEAEHDQVASILASWTRSLLQTPPDIGAIERSLAPTLQGCSFQPSEQRVVKPGAALSIIDLRFATPAPSFLASLRSYLDGFSRLHTADFQVTRIQQTTAGVSTEIRYDFVGEGQGFFREQRSGMWSLDWTKGAAGKYTVTAWRNSSETRSRSTQPWFTDVTAQALGHNRSHSDQLLHGVDYWRTTLDGASRIDIYGHNGIAAGRAFGGDRDDIYICQPAGLPNRLYRNRGDGTFEDVSEQSGVDILDNTACALFADVLNRGHQDLIVVRAAGPSLLLNDGKGKFSLQPEAFQFASPPQGTFTGAAIADYDRDGWLDIYFCLYVYYQGTEQYKYPSPYYDANNGPPNFLMRNNRDGSFRDVTRQAGLDQNNTRYSFCCGWTDSDQNGWPDLYVVNDFGRKNLYRNHGDGTFTDVAAEAGTEDIGAGMSIACFDYDNDGFEDLYVANMWTAGGERVTQQPAFQPTASASALKAYKKHSMGNSLLHNDGTGHFTDQTHRAEVGLGRWSWGSDAWDFDHDGHMDLYVTNGMISGPIHEDLNSFFWRQVVANSPEQAKPWEPYEQGWSAINELIRADYTWSGFERNVFHANNGDGTFSDVSGAVGLDFLEDGRCFALADIDGDGRLELLLKNRNAPQLRILKNVQAKLPPSISFVLQGTKSNRDAVGAVVTLETSLGRQTRRLQAGSGFLAQHSKELVFGLGTSTGNVKATVRWPSGLVQTFDNIPANHRIFLEEGSDITRPEAFREPPSTAVPPSIIPEMPPESLEIWLLAPVPAPFVDSRGVPSPVYLWDSQNPATRPQTERFPNLDLGTNQDAAAVYNILYRSLFDRHRDLTLPAALLLNEKGEMVKLYLGSFDPHRLEQDLRQIPSTPGARLHKGLPFPGKAIDYQPGRNHLSLGSVFYQYGYYEQSEQWFRAALRDDPSSAEACYSLGSVYLKQSKPGQAKTQFEAAVKGSAGYPETKPNAWNNLGLLAAQEGETESSVHCFEQALQLSPDYVIALQNLGNAYRQEKRWDDAQRTLERAVSLAPQDAEAHYALAMVFAQTERSTEAFEQFQKALQSRPEYPEALNNLGILYLRTHRVNEAIAEFETCIRTAPQFDQSYMNLARVYAIAGDRDKARQTLLALLKQHPGHPQAQKALEEMQ